MHLLLVIILLWLVFPIFGRVVGWVLSAVFWVIAVIFVMGLFDVFSHLSSA